MLNSLLISPSDIQEVRGGDDSISFSDCNLIAITTEIKMAKKDLQKKLLI